MSCLYNLYKPTLDGVMKINQLFNSSKIPNKINLVIGAYQRNNKPYIFNSVTIAKNKIFNLNHEYLPITGDVEFNNLSKKLYFGEKTNLSVVQTLSGTGSLYLLAQLLGEIVTENKTIYVSNPTWDNHFSVFHTSKLQLSTYNYLQNENNRWIYVL